MRCSRILETQARRGISRQLDRTPRVGIGKHQLAHGLRAGNEYPFANLQLLLFRNKGLDGLGILGRGASPQSAVRVLAVEGQRLGLHPGQVPMRRTHFGIRRRYARLASELSP
jgi:hypothetical protein